MYMDIEKIKWNARVWATRTLQKEAENQLDIMITALLPKGYCLYVKKGDYDGVDKYQRRRTHKASLTPDRDAPHWVTYGYSSGDAKAKMLGELLADSPVFPLTKI